MSNYRIVNEYWGSFDDDYGFYYGPYSSVDEAIEEMNAEYRLLALDDPEGNTLLDVYFIGKKMEFVPIVDEDKVIEQIDEDAYMEFECCGCYEDIFDGVTKEQKEELSDMLTEAYNRWAEKNKVEYNTFLITEINEYYAPDCV